MMISDQAQQGIQHLLTQALDECFSVNGQLPVMTPLTEITPNDNTRVTVLTVSSYVFKLMLFVCFDVDAKTKQLFLKDAGEELSAAEAEQALCDVISEKENLCCGILSRELAEFFPHMGMSTPNFLEQGSLSYMEMLHYDYMHYFELSLKEDVRLQIGLCMCAYDNVDFTVTAKEETAETGELELF